MKRLLVAIPFSLAPAGTKMYQKTLFIKKNTPTYYFFISKCL